MSESERPKHFLVSRQPRKPKYRTTIYIESRKHVDRVFYGLRKFDPLDIDINQEKQEIELPDEILALLNFKDGFDYNSLSDIDSKYHLPIARLLIDKNHYEAQRVLDNFSNFNGLSVETISEALLRRGFFFLILENETLFAGYPDILREARNKDLYF